MKSPRYKTKKDSSKLVEAGVEVQATHSCSGPLPRPTSGERSAGSTLLSTGRCGLDK